MANVQIWAVSATLASQAKTVQSKKLTAWPVTSTVMHPMVCVTKKRASASAKRDTQAQIASSVAACSTKITAKLKVGVVM